MIFDEQLTRKPDHYPWAQEFIEAMHNGFWTDKEFSFQSDIQDYKTHLRDVDREIITKALSAIGQIEIQVKTFWAKLGANLPHPSLADLGYVMANTEVIHGNAYERLLKVLDVEHLFEENMKLDIINGRTNYLRKYNQKVYTDNRKQYIYALILFTLFVENVSLFSQFYIINWYYTNKGALKDTNQQVRYTRSEEILHALIGTKIINTIREEHPNLFEENLFNRVKIEALEAYIAESKIVDWMVGDFHEPGLSAPILKAFIADRINRSLRDIGFPPFLDTPDPELLQETEWFNEQVNGVTAVDFFHQRPTEYSKNTQSFDEDSLFGDE